jgi:hypothetical protein
MEAALNFLASTLPITKTGPEHDAFLSLFAATNERGFVVDKLDLPAGK